MFSTLCLGWINSFLSWEGFVPLGKLSFNIYLIHFDLIHVVWLTFSYSLVITNMTCVSLAKLILTYMEIFHQK